MYLYYYITAQISVAAGVHRPHLSPASGHLASCSQNVDLWIERVVRCPRQ